MGVKDLKQCKGNIKVISNELFKKDWTNVTQNKIGLDKRNETRNEKRETLVLCFENLKKWNLIQQELRSVYDVVQIHWS